MTRDPSESRPARSRRRDASGPVAALARGLAVVAVLAAAATVALKAYNGVPFRPYTTMYITVPAVGNLRAHDQVRLAGVRIGQVAGQRITADGLANVRLQLEPDAPHLPSDTRVSVRAAGLLGARYVDLVPGRSRQLLPPGATIRGGKDALTFGAAEALDTFDAGTRGGLGHMIRELGVGMLGRGGQLNDALHAAADAQRPSQALIHSVLARPGAAVRLIPSLEQAADVMAAAAPDLTRAFPPMNTALRPFAENRRATQATLEAAPPALRAVGSGLSTGRRLLAATRALAGAAHETLPSAPSGLHAASVLLRTSHGSLRRTASLLRSVRSAIPDVLRTTTALRPILQPARDGLQEVVPTLRYIGRYGCDVKNFGAVFRSMTGIGSTPGGEAGPLSQFRFQIIPSPIETTSTKNPQSLGARDRYSPPCAYPSGSYPVARLPGGGR